MKRRLIAFLCILSMCMSLVTPAMAADVTATDETDFAETADDIVDTDEIAEDLPVQEEYGEEQEDSVEKEVNEISDTETEEKIITSSCYWINPIYEDIISKTELFQNNGISVASVEDDVIIDTPVEEEAAYITTKEEAASILRKGLVNHEESITINYQTSLENVALNTNEEFNAWCNAFGNEVLGMAKRHTGNSKEGDYLKHQIGATKMVFSGLSSDVFKLSVVFTPIYYTTVAQEEELDTAVSNLISELNLSGKSDYEKVKVIYDYICENISYDNANLNNEEYLLKYTAYAALCNKTAVCQGYAVLFYRLALEAGVDVRVITGDTNGDGKSDHAWNIVKLGDKYYNIDATWDRACVEAEIDYKYFLKGTANFNDHIRDDEYSSDSFISDYPISKTDYESMIDATTYQLIDVLSEDGEVIDQTLQVTSSGNVINYCKVILNETDSKQFVTTTGEDLETILYTFDNFDGYWYNLDEGFEFDITVGQEYVSDMISIWYSAPRMMSGGELSEKIIPAGYGSVELTIGGILKDTIEHNDETYICLESTKFNGTVSYLEDYTIEGYDGYWALPNSEVKFKVEIDDGYILSNISVDNVTLNEPDEEGVYSFTTTESEKAYIRIETEEAPSSDSDTDSDTESDSYIQVENISVSYEDCDSSAMKPGDTAYVTLTLYNPTGEECTFDNYRWHLEWYGEFEGERYLKAITGDNDTTTIPAGESKNINFEYTVGEYEFAGPRTLISITSFINGWDVGELYSYSNNEDGQFVLLEGEKEVTSFAYNKEADFIIENSKYDVDSPKINSLSFSTDSEDVIITSNTDITLDAECQDEGMSGIKSIQVMYYDQENGEYDCFESTLNEAGMTEGLVSLVSSNRPAGNYILSDVTICDYADNKTFYYFTDGELKSDDGDVVTIDKLPQSYKVEAESYDGITIEALSVSDNANNLKAGDSFTLTLTLKNNSNEEVSVYPSRFMLRWTTKINESVEEHWEYPEGEVITIPANETKNLSVQITTSEYTYSGERVLDVISYYGLNEYEAEIHYSYDPDSKRLVGIDENYNDVHEIPYNGEINWNVVTADKTDNTAPIIEKFEVLSENITVPGNVKFRINLSDEGYAKTSYFSLEFKDINNSKNNFYEYFESSNLIEVEKGYEFNLSLSTKLIKGTYRLSAVSIVDVNNKERYYTFNNETGKLNDNEGNEFSSTSLVIQESECTDTDFESPVFQELTLPEEITAGEIFEVKVKTTNEEKLGNIEIQLVKKGTSGHGSDLISVDSRSISKTEDGEFIGVFSLNNYVESGKYILDRLVIEDASVRQNRTSYFYDENTNSLIELNTGEKFSYNTVEVNVIADSEITLATETDLLGKIQEAETGDTIVVTNGTSDSYMKSLSSEQLLAAKNKELILIIVHTGVYCEMIIDTKEIPDTFSGTLYAGAARDYLVKDDLPLEGIEACDDVFYPIHFIISESNIPFTLKFETNEIFDGNVIRLVEASDAKEKRIIANNLVSNEGIVEYKFEDGIGTDYENADTEDGITYYYGYLSTNTKLDTVSPEILEYWPASEDNVTLCYEVDLEVSAKDDKEIEKIDILYKQIDAEEVLIDSVSASDNQKELTANIQWDISKLNGGAYQLIYRVYDTSGNSTEQISDVTIRTYKAPSVPALYATSSYKSAELTWLYTGDENELKHFVVYSCDVDGNNRNVLSATTVNNKKYSVTGLTENTYYFIVEAVDFYGNATKSNVITVNPILTETEAPVAVIMPEEITGIADQEIKFSAKNSTDNDKIVSYEWDFGDGSKGNGETCTHAYTGDKKLYKVSLTVTDASGNVNTTTKDVNIFDTTGDDAEYAVMTVKVINGYEAGTPAIGGATVKVNKLDEAGSSVEFETTVVTATDGITTLIVPRGSCTVSVIANGFTATSRSVNVNPNEAGEYSYIVSMVPGGVSPVDGSLKTRELDYDEIVAAGIDVNDPANEHIVETTVKFAFKGNPELGFDVSGLFNGDGKLVDWEGFKWKFIEFKDEEDDDDNDDDNPNPDPVITPELPDPIKPSKKGMNVGVYPISEKFYLVIYGEAHWLKEMYNVELVVINNSYTDDITDCVAELELPEGLSLASMIDGVQSEKVEIGTIPKATKDGGVNNSNTTWYVRGDKEGEYQLTANVTGNHLDLNGEKNPFALTFTTDDNNKIKVYAGSSLKLTITAQNKAYKDKDYYVQFTLENVSDKSLYNLSFGLTDAEQYEAQIMVKTDKTTTTFEKSSILTKENFKDNATMEIPSFDPGEKIDIMFKTTTCFEDDNQEFISSKLFVTDIAYRLQDYVVTTLEGSTTEIPTEIKFAEVEKDGFGEWAWGKVKDTVTDIVEGKVIELIDDKVFKGVPVAEYGVKIFEFADENLAPEEANSSVVISVSEGAYISTKKNTVTGGENSSFRGETLSNYTLSRNTAVPASDVEGCVAVYTDADPDNYVVSEDGKQMTITGDAKIYVLRESEGAASVTATTTYKQTGIDGWTINPESEEQIMTYELVGDTDSEYVSGLPTAEDIILEEPETTAINVPYTGTKTVKFPFLAVDNNGDYFVNANNLIWNVVNENNVNATGISISNDGVLTITDEAESGTYTVKLSIKDTEKSLSKQITLIKNECVHEWDEGIIETNSTCIADGSIKYTCSLCGKTYNASIPATGHKEVTDKAVAPTCTKTGLTEGSHCSVCSKVFIAQNVIPALGHSYTKYTIDKNPTCTEDGSKSAPCDHGCGTTDTKVISATGHMKVVDKAIKATCTKTGLTEGSHCSVCNKTLIAQKTIAATGHSYGSYKTTTKATFGKTGVQTATCTKCSDKKTKSIAAVKTPTLSTTTYTFNNKVKTPSVTVKNSSGTKLMKVTDTSKNGFAVKYASGRKSVGKYSVKVTLTGANYTGTKMLYFKINPKGVAIWSLSRGTKAFTVKWKKPTSTYRKQMTGYQIRYSTSSKMTSAKTVTVKSTTATSKKISKLKAKKYYYVQLRTYKKIGSTYYYSGWSTVKKVKTK